MKGTICSVAAALVSGSLVSSPLRVEARDSDGKSVVLAAAQPSKTKQTNACRARYRDCVKLNQIPSSECQYIYQDCIKHIY